MVEMITENTGEALPSIVKSANLAYSERLEATHHMYVTSASQLRAHTLRRLRQSVQTVQTEGVHMQASEIYSKGVFRLDGSIYGIKYGTSIEVIKGTIEFWLYIG